MTPAIKYGQIIEYIPDRLYLASYTTPPTADTLFPYPARQPTRRSPNKRSARNPEGPSAVLSERDNTPPHYFSIDDSLLYNAFHHDFGPLHVGHLYRFAVQFHDILGAPENRDRPVVFWSKADARSRANAACILAAYMVLIQAWTPHLALAPIAQADPPLMPFRDAGYSQADYGITVQDVVYGVWRAKEQGFCALPSFDLEEYERYERVDQGDFNWLTPDFLAFASPQHKPVEPIKPSSPLYASLPTTVKEVEAHPTLPGPFKNVLSHFAERNIGLVVRLNSELYCPSYFTALGIEHLDMIFDDGTCPNLATVRKFIRLSHEMITVRKRGIAVHCKAGLGRTGCLIGAYLIYRYGFTANEIIAYMRFMRPGMVVGPQQHWLHLNQGTFREWWIEEQFEIKMREKMASKAPSTPTRMSLKSYMVNAQVTTPPNASRRSPLGEVDNEQRSSIGVQEDCLPAPTPGQPRKTSRAVDRHHPYNRSVSNYTTTEDERTIQRETEMISIHRSSLDDPDGEDEWTMRMKTSRKSSQSPGRVMSQSPSQVQSRSISQTTTTIYSIDNDSSHDIENVGSGIRSKTTGTMKAGSGSCTLSKVRGSPKRSGDSLREKPTSGVRKISGRIGSLSHSNPRKVSGL
ncbi:putative tyrosine-protein phosphatase CDC14 [Amylocarpus encephaloides]|uniref:protein-tyrosine-phosphatase n=1 Tax=Amylocarpus encephaloides TaxID=45428 RepID=A0A9P7YQ62_9HELO|nr:putative tyrosine-protein phosphatase CDC14 [Amylocarpus encephaloides]